MRRVLSHVLAWATMTAIVVGPPQLGLLDWRVWCSALVAVVAVEAFKDK